MTTGNAPSAELPQAVITPNTVLCAVGETPGCGMRHFFQTFVHGKQGGTLRRVKEVTDELVKNNLITVHGYGHYLTEEKGKKAFSKLRGSS